MDNANEKKATETGLAAKAPTAAELAKLLTGDALEGVAERPEGLADGSAGLEGVRMDEIKLPRLAIAQGLSPQLVPGTPEYIKGLAIGDMFNDVTGEIYGPGPLTVIPVYRHVERLVFKDNKPVARGLAWNDPRMQWNGDEPPEGTEYVDFVSLLIRPGKAPEQIVVTIKTTNKHQKNAAKMWTTHANGRGTDLWTSFYKIRTMIHTGTNRKGGQSMYGYFVVEPPKFIPVGTPAGDALVALGAAFNETVKAGYQVEREVGADDDFDPEALEGRV